MVKSASKNTLHMSLLVYGNIENKWKQRIILRSSEVVMMWHGDQNRRLRSCGGAREWLYEQCCFGYGDHIIQVCAQLHKSVPLETFGLEVDFPIAPKDCIRDGHCAQQDALATNLGDMVMNLFESRLRNGLRYLAGWPLRAVLFTSSDGLVVQRALKEFKEASDIFDELSVAPGSQLLHSMVDHSSFQTLPCLQLKLLLQRSGWEVTSGIVNFASQKASRLLGTQICEDGFQRQKAAARRSASHKVNDEMCMLAPIHKGLVDKVHHFSSPPTDSVVVPRRSALATNVFQPVVSMTWDKLKDIKGGIAIHFMVIAGR